MSVTIENTMDSFSIKSETIPTIQGTRTTTSYVTGGTEKIITLPDSIAVGEMILALIAIDGDSTITVDTDYSGSNWTLDYVASGTPITGIYAWKIAEGSDALKIYFGGDSEGGTAISLRLSNANGIFNQFYAPGAHSANSDPPELTPGDGEQTYLWIAVRYGDDVNIATAAPTNFDNLTSIASSSSNGASVSIANRTYKASVLNPSAFTSDDKWWVTSTIAISPV